MNVLFACMSVHYTCVWYAWRSRALDALELELEVVVNHHRCREENLRPLQEQQAL